MAILQIYSGISEFNNSEIDLNDLDIQYPAETEFDGTIFNVSDSLTLQGEVGNLLDITNASTWYLNSGGSQTVQYVDVSNSDASGGDQILADPSSDDSGFNINWDFGSLYPYQIRFVVNAASDADRFPLWISTDIPEAHVTNGVHFFKGATLLKHYQLEFEDDFFRGYVQTDLDEGVNDFAIKYGED